MRTARWLSFVLPALLAVTGASADVIWDESINGDLSGDGLAPTPFVLDSGTHSLLASTGVGDREYISITIPVGLELSELWLAAYQGTDGVAFVGIQEGPQFTVQQADGPAGLLGWSHFGTGAGQVGTNILDDIGVGAGAIGFDGPLTAGTYSFWMQQLAPAVSYQFDFVVVPAPACAGIFAMAGLAACRRRRG